MLGRARGQVPPSSGALRQACFTLSLNCLVCLGGAEEEKEVPLPKNPKRREKKERKPEMLINRAVSGFCCKEISHDREITHLAPLPLSWKMTGRTKPFCFEDELS